METGKNIAVLNYQFYCIINFFMKAVQNSKFQSFQHRLAETEEYKTCLLPPMTTKEIIPLLLRNAPGHNNSHLHDLKQDRDAIF